MLIRLFPSLRLLPNLLRPCCIFFPSSSAPRSYTLPHTTPSSSAPPTETCASVNLAYSTASSFDPAISRPTRFLEEFGWSRLISRYETRPSYQEVSYSALPSSLLPVPVFSAELTLYDNARLSSFPFSPILPSCLSHLGCSPPDSKKHPGSYDAYLLRRVPVCSFSDEQSPAQLTAPTEWEEVAGSRQTILGADPPLPLPSSHPFEHHRITIDRSFLNSSADLPGPTCLPLPSPTRNPLILLAKPEDRISLEAAVLHEGFNLVS
jgi:hypothetical protein